MFKEVSVEAYEEDSNVSSVERGIIERTKKSYYSVHDGSKKTNIFIPDCYLLSKVDRKYIPCRYMNWNGIKDILFDYPNQIKSFIERKLGERVTGMPEIKIYEDGGFFCNACIGRLRRY